MKASSALLIAALSTLSSSCSSFGGRDAAVVAATPSSVTLRFKEGDLAGATSRADTLCGEHGLTARLQRVSPAGGDDRVGAFDCVPKT